ncbi:MAG: response regulator [Polyangiaceae bacterium]
MSASEPNATPSESLAPRLLVAVAAPAALLAVVATVLTLQIVRLVETTRWVEHTDAVIAKTQGVLLDIVNQETGIRGYLLTERPEYLEPFVKAKPMDALDDLRLSVSDNPEELARVDEAISRYRVWFEGLRNVEDPKSVAVLKSLESISERRRRMDAVRKTLGDILAHEEFLRSERFKESGAATDALLRTSVPLFLVLAVALVLISRKQLTSIAGSYKAMLGAERKTRAAVELESWIRREQVALADTLRGDLSLLDIGSRTLERLTRSSGAVVGTFYVVEPGGLKLEAAWGIDPSVTPAHFPTGAGLVGRVAASKKPERVTGLGAESLRVTSGTTNGASNELLLLPALVDGDTRAVVELAFTGPMDPRTELLAERVGETIGFAVQSSVQKARLRELLEESQRQGEELQTQQEELRVANEELQQQSDALRGAQAQLEERKEELETSNASLAFQRDSLERAQKALIDKASELERASRYKSEFLANMSHELRTPLNSSLILAKLLADNKRGNLTEEQVKFANTIYGAGNDLLSLINDILDLAKVEAGRLEVRIVPTTVGRILEPMSGMFEAIARDKGLAFSMPSGPALLEVVDTDERRVQQILKNLLSNAFKFTESGTVSLAVEATGEGVSFAVRDTGIGIRKEQHGLIFEAFQQADGTANRKYGGTGLGLSISRDLARTLGGDLTVDSTPGSGSVFVLALPRTLDAPRVQAPRPALSLPAAIPVRTADERDSSIPPRIPDDRASLEGTSRVLLVVEDDVTFAEVLTNLAREAEFKVLVAHGADEGVRLAEKFVPTAILLDMGLPDHSGLSVIERLKRNAATRHIPIHVISATDHSRIALSMGAVGYIVKPAAREAIAEAIAKLKDGFVRVRHLLVVEDDAVQREAVTKLLASEDVRIEAVATVADALRELASRPFDCVVTDLTLPDASGYELLDRMAKDQGYAFPPVIVYTGRTLTAEEEQHLRRYSNSIIVKGARSPERLLDEVTLFLHQVESSLPVERQRMLRQARDRDATFEGCTILIAEDDVRNIFALTSVLEPKGARLVLARNGREAIAKLEADPRIDLVLMDVMMPEMGGLEAMRVIRARREGWSRIPIIALTAKAMKDDREHCLAAGANDYVAKPLDVDMLLSLVRVWMPQR